MAMKKLYIKPMMLNGLSCECKHLIMGSLKGDGLNMQIKSESAAYGASADSRQGGSFWDESE